MFRNRLYRDPPKIKYQIDIWPEWTKETLSGEIWNSQDKESNINKEKEKVITENKTELFEDPEGQAILPPSLVACQWLRPYQLNILNPLNSKKPVVAVDNNYYEYFDLVSASGEALKSETLRYIVSQITLLFYLTNPSTSHKDNEATTKKTKKKQKNKNKNNPNEDSEENLSNNADTYHVLDMISEENKNDDNINNNNKKSKKVQSRTNDDEKMYEFQKASSLNFDFNNKLYRLLPDWKPWYHIFSSVSSGGNKKNKKVTQEPFKDTSNEPFKTIPEVNTHGKYLVRLYWMGLWRKITVDDRIPVGKNNAILLPMTFNNNKFELWPILLTKALLKIAALDYPVNYPAEDMEWEFGDMSVLQCLTSWIPELLPLEDMNEKELWGFLLQNVDHYKQPQDTSHSLVEDNTESRPNSNKNKKVFKRSMSKQQSAKAETPSAKLPNLPETPECIVLGLYRGNTKPVLLKREKKELTRRHFELVQYGLTPDTSHPLFISQVRNIRLMKRAAKAVLPAWMMVRPPTTTCPDDETEDIKALLLVSGFVNNKTELDCINEEMKSMIAKDNPVSNIAYTPQKAADQKVERPSSKNSSKKTSKMSRVKTREGMTEEPELPSLPRLPILRPFWVPLQAFLENFSFVLVLHKIDTYKYNCKSSDYPIDEEFSENVENQANKTATNNAKKGVDVLLLEKEKKNSFYEYSPKFLYVDSCEPTEIIVNFTCFCKWNGFPIFKYVNAQKALKNQEILEIYPPQQEKIPSKNKKKSYKSHYVAPRSGELLSDYFHYMDPDGEMKRVAKQTTVLGGHFNREEGFFRDLCCCDIHPSCCLSHSGYQTTHDEDDEDEDVFGDKKEEEEDEPGDNKCMNDGNYKRYEKVKKNRKEQERVVTNVVYSEQMFMLQDLEEDGGMSIDAGCPAVRDYEGHAGNSITRNGILLISDYSWKYPPKQNFFSTIKTTGSSSLLLTIPPGRKILKFETSAPSFSHIHLLCDKALVLASEDDVMIHLLKESKVLIEYSHKTSKYLSNLFLAYGKWEKYKQCLSYFLYHLLSCSFLLLDDSFGNIGNQNNNNPQNNEIENYLNSELVDDEEELKKINETNNNNSGGENINIEKKCKFNEAFREIHYLKENLNYFKRKDKSDQTCTENNTNHCNNNPKNLFTLCNTRLSFRKQEEVFRQAIYTAIIELDNKQQIHDKTEEVTDKKRAQSKKQATEMEEGKERHKSLRTAQMNFALRVLLFDSTTPNPLSVDYSHQPENLKNQTKVSFEKSKEQKENKTFVEEHLLEDHSNSSFKEFLSESSALKLYSAAVKIQRHWRGHFFRMICKLRCMPQITLSGRKNKKHYDSVMKMAIILSRAIRSNAEFFGLQFYKKMFRLYPEWQRLFSFHDDEDVRCSMKEFEGRVSLDADDYSIVLRDVFHATEEQMLGFFKFYCYSSVKNTNHFLLRVFNNDTNCLLTCTLKGIKPLLYSPNKYGYTVVVFQRKKDDQISDADENFNNSAFKTKNKSFEKRPRETSSVCGWSLKVLGSAISGCLVKEQSEEPLKVHFNVTSICQYLVPERSIFIFRYRLWVTQSQLVSLHLVCSNPCAFIELNIHEDEVVRTSVKGQGSVFLPSFHLVQVEASSKLSCPHVSPDDTTQPDVETEEKDKEKDFSKEITEESITGLDSEELPVKQRNFEVDANEIKELKGKLSTSIDKQMGAFSSFPTISNVKKRLVERHQYKVEAVIVNDSWSLSEEEEKEIQKLIKSSNIPANVKSTDKKLSKRSQNSWKESEQTKNLSTDEQLNVLPVETTLPHWSLKVIRDDSLPEETFVLQKNSDETDLLERWKASWEMNDARRCSRARVRRQEFVCKHLLKDVKLEKGKNKKDECGIVEKNVFEESKKQKAETNKEDKKKKSEKEENEEEEEEDDEIVDSIKKDKDNQKNAVLDLAHNKHNQLPDFVQIYLNNLQNDTNSKSNFFKFLNKNENKNNNMSNNNGTFDEMVSITNENKNMSKIKINEMLLKRLQKLLFKNFFLNIDDFVKSYEKSKLFHENPNEKSESDLKEQKIDICKSLPLTFRATSASSSCLGLEWRGQKSLKKFEGGNIINSTNNNTCMETTRNTVGEDGNSNSQPTEQPYVNTLEYLYTCGNEGEIEKEEKKKEEEEFDYEIGLDCLQAEMEAFEGEHLQAELWKSTLEERSSEVLKKEWWDYKGLEALWVERMVEAVNNREELKKQIMLQKIERKKEEKRMEIERATPSPGSGKAASKKKGRKSEKSKK